MALKKGLGKGLNTLIPTETKQGKQGDIEDKNILTIKITELEPYKDQPRKAFNEDSLHELADSIKQFGVLQPILVSKQDGYYEIIAGERRWRAARMAGLKEVPIIVKEFSNKERIEVSLIENIQREDLNPIEEALAYQDLMNEYHLKQDEVAERVSKSRVTITNAIRLLKLDGRVQQMIIDGMLTGGHTRPLISIEDSDLQYDIASKAFDEKLSVREVEKYVKHLSLPTKEKAASISSDMLIIFKNIENRMKDSLGTKVSVRPKNKDNGKIEIEYYSQEELERIVELLGKEN